MGHHSIVGRFQIVAHETEVGADGSLLKFCFGIVANLVIRFKK